MSISGTQYTLSINLLYGYGTMYAVNTPDVINAVISISVWVWNIAYDTFYYMVGVYQSPYGYGTPPQA